MQVESWSMTLPLSSTVSVTNRQQLYQADELLAHSSQTDQQRQPISMSNYPTCIRFTIVDLPPPEEPTSANFWPGITSKLMPCNTQFEGRLG